MAQFFIQLGGIIKANILRINPRAGIAGLGELGENIRVFSLAPAHYRRQHHKTGAFLVLEQGIDDLLGALRLDPRSALRAMLHPSAGKEQAQIIVNLGDRADGGARITISGFLVDRDGWRKALDHIDVWLIHLAQEHTGV